MLMQAPLTSNHVVMQQAVSVFWSCHDSLDNKMFDKQEVRYLYWVSQTFSVCAEMPNIN